MALSRQQARSTRDYAYDLDEILQSCYRRLSGDDGKPTWHPFSQSRLNEPKASSMKLYIELLDDWD